MLNHHRRVAYRALVLAIALGLLTTFVASPAASAKAKKKAKAKKTAVTTKKRKATVTTAAPSAAAPKVNKGTIKIGVIYSSFNATSGVKTTNESYKVAQAWEDGVNDAGGINGYKVQLLYKDGAQDTARISNAVRELDKAGVLALAAGDFSVATPAIAPYLNSKSIASVGGTANADETRFDPMIFPTSGNNAALRYSIPAAVKDAGAKHFFLAYCQENPLCATGLPTYRYAIQREGVKMTAQAASAVATDYTAQCLAAKNAGADWFQVNGINFANTVRDCSRQNYHPIYGNGGSITRAIVDAANGERLAGSLADIPIFYDGPEMRDFKKALAKTDLNAAQTPPTQISVEAWEGLEMVRAVINKLTVANPTRQDFLEGLYSIKGETLGGMSFPIDYSAQRPGTGLHAANDCWTEYILKDGTLYMMDRNGQTSVKPVWICGTGLVFKANNPVPGGLEPFV